MEVFGWGYWRICCAVELLINLEMMACPSKAMMLGVLMTDEDWVRIDACLKDKGSTEKQIKIPPRTKCHNRVLCCAM